MKTRPRVAMIRVSSFVYSRFTNIVFQLIRVLAEKIITSRNKTTMVKVSRARVTDVRISFTLTNFNKGNHLFDDDDYRTLARSSIARGNVFTLYGLIFPLDPINLTLSSANTNAIVETFFFTRNSRPVKENRYAIATEYAAIHFAFPRGTWGRKLS